MAQQRIDIDADLSLGIAVISVDPDHVERLLLDSQVVTPDHDPLGTDSLRALPGAVNSICFAACKTLAPDIGTCEALLRGESVPVAALDQDWVSRFGRSS